jgi:hypothetical protein
MFRQGFTCLALLTFMCLVFRIRGYHPLWPDFPDRSTRFHTLLGCSAFARHY